MTNTRDSGNALQGQIISDGDGWEYKESVWIQMHSTSQDPYNIQREAMTELHLQPDALPPTPPRTRPLKLLSCNGTPIFLEQNPQNHGLLSSSGQRKDWSDKKRVEKHSVLAFLELKPKLRGRTMISLDE